jgi:succinyl-CoA synthetase beta subunit
MNIHEYQGKEVFRKFGVPVPEGQVAFNADEAEAVAKKLFAAGASLVVVKAQIHAGGRGKAGGVKLATSAAEAKQYAAELIGKVLVTHQTGPEGKEVKRLLLEVGSKIKKEFYLAILVDRAISAPTMIVSTEGGMDIEAVAAKTPEKILKDAIDPSIGMQPYQARKLAQRLGLTGELAAGAAKLMLGVYKTFVETDASLVEVNPLVIAQGADGKDMVLALDAKMNFDDNALYRHKDIAAMRDLNEEEPLETRANAANLNYIKLDGTIGCMVNGAGLAMATMDIIKHYGGNPANFLDVGGGATAEQVTEAFQILLADKNVQAILINIFGGIMKCDVIATGIIAAAKQVNLKVPLVVRLEGTNVEIGKKLIEESGLPIITATGMADAAQKVVNATKKSK